MLHGCIPVIIMDEVHAVFESILDYDSFSVHVPESSIPDVPQILQAITAPQILRMQQHLSTVWQRCAMEDQAGGLAGRRVV